MPLDETIEPTIGTASQSEQELRDRLEAAERSVAELQTALDSRIVIEQAKGVLRERFGWSVDEAFELLRHAARAARMSIHVLADQVVKHDKTPNPLVIALARTARLRAAQMRELAELHRVRAHELEEAIRGQQERLAWMERDRAEESRRRRKQRPESPP